MNTVYIAKIAILLAPDIRMAFLATFITSLSFTRLYLAYVSEEKIPASHVRFIAILRFTSIGMVVLAVFWSSVIPHTSRCRIEIVIFCRGSSILCSY
jgi:hypothetical protein